MEYFDTIVIGGGILGCFAARNLCRWKLSVLLLEAAEDVCTGVTRANSAIVYAGYDMKPGTKKAEMTVRANADFDRLCRELEVPFSRRGSLMVSSGPLGYRSLVKKLEAGKQNQVPGLRLLSPEEARALEPMLSDSITAALYAPSTGTVNPWLLGIAAYENALQNGCRAKMNTAVTAIAIAPGGYCVTTNRGSFSCRSVINCAGIHAAHMQDMIYPGGASTKLNGADYLVMDPLTRSPKHIIFEETEAGKGITAIPCVEGNLLLESPVRPLYPDFATTQEGMDAIKTAAARLLPGLNTQDVIRSFGAVRPNPHKDGGSIRDFCIEQPAEDFISFIGIKTPGLTCANELGRSAAEAIAQKLQAMPNPHFDPHRPSIVATDDQIVCQCQNITKGQILEAIRRGATTPNGVKRRVGTGMGRCQGSRCNWQIQLLLEEHGHGTL